MGLIFDGRLNAGANIAIFNAILCWVFLFFSHGIIDRHGGRISVDPDVEEGTTFSIDLPLDAAPSEA